MGLHGRLAEEERRRDLAVREAASDETQALGDEGFSFSLPLGSLAPFVLSAILVGVIAAIMPARRAAQLNVLVALQYE
jgi:ABC-type lipoprotein release transport system permease subunit